MKPEIEVERRAGTIRRIRLSPGEIGCLAGILQTIANEGGRDDEPVG